jgi:hypothetical protein
MEPDGFIPDIRNYSTPMLYDNEVVMLILGAGVAGLIIPISKESIPGNG